MALIALFLGVGVAKEWGMDPKKMVKEVGDMMKREEKATPAAVAGTPAIVAESSEKPDDTPKLSPSQERAVDKVKSDSRIKTLFDIPREKKATKLDTYLEFINTQLKDKPLAVLICPANPKNSIFSVTGSLDESVTVPSDMDGVILKDILRLYLTGVSIPSSVLTQDTYKPMIETSARKYDTQKDTLISAIQKVYNVTDTAPENMETKISGYNLTLDGESIAKDNMNIVIEPKASGYVATLTIKDPSKLNLSSIKPMKVEFDAEGKLVTTEVKIS